MADSQYVVGEGGSWNPDGKSGSMSKEQIDAVFAKAAKIKKKGKK